MTPRDDRFPNMLSSAQFDTAIERVLRGDAVGDDVASLVGFVDDMRVMAHRPPPPPSPELAALLGGADAGWDAPANVATLPPRTRTDLQQRSTQPRPRRSRAAGLRVRVAALGVAGKAALVLALATASAAGAAAGILPEPATHFLRRAIELVTPFELPDDASARHHGGADPDGRTAQVAERDEAAVPSSGPRPAAPVRDPGAADIRTQDPEAGADEGAGPLPTSTDGTSGWIGTYSEGDTSAGQPVGPAAQPAPKNGDVPPGHSPSGTSQPGGSGAGGTPLMDHGATQARPSPPVPTGPPSQRGSSSGSPSSPSREGRHHRPRPGHGPGEGSSGGASPSGPRQAPPVDPSPGGGPDRGQCGKPGPIGSPPADCGPDRPHRSGPPETGGEAVHHSDGPPGGHTGPVPPAGGPAPEAPPSSP